MEPLLLVVTVGSLLVALVMSAAAWRLSREERARSAARVAALAAAASETPAPEHREPVAFRAAHPIVVDSPAAPPESRSPWTVARIPSVAPASRLAPAAAPAPVPAPVSVAAVPVPRTPDLVLHQAAAPEDVPSWREPVAHGNAIGDSFLGGSNAPSEGGGRQRILAIAASVLFVVVAGGGYWMVFGDRTTASAASAAAVNAAPLELVSMRHERRGSRLSVSGLVRNPVAGEAVDRLTAVVFLFDQQGGFVTSSRAEVDFKRLVPGDESPFVIAMDAPTNVARYRVSFRTDAGVVPHVDRRGQDPAPPSTVQNIVR